MAITYEDMCPGYVREHYATQGRCCCGLHWTGVMPIHTAAGVLVSDEALERLDRRAADADRARQHRQALRDADRRAQTVTFLPRPKEGT